MFPSTVHTKFLLITLSVLVYFKAIDAFSDCGSQVGAIVSIDIPGCDNNNRCTLKRDTNASIEITFNSTVEASEIKAIVHGVILGVPIAFPLPNSDGCVDSGLTCPIKANSVYKYVASLPVKKTYPLLSLDVKWELRTSDETDIICALIPAKIAP